MTRLLYSFHQASVPVDRRKTDRVGRHTRYFHRPDARVASVRQAPVSAIWIRKAAAKLPGRHVGQFHFWRFAGWKPLY